MSSRRTFLATSAALAAGAAMREARAQTSMPVIAGPLSGPDASSIYYPQQQGWFRQAGVDLTVTPMPNGAAGMSAMVAGSVNAAEGNVLSLCEAHAKGIPVTLVAPGPIFDASAPPNAQLIVSAASDIRTPKDINGKTVAVPSLSDLLSISTRGLIDQAGGDSTSVHFVEMPPATMVGALAAQRVDAVTLYEPFRSAALGQGGRPIGTPYASIAPKFLVAVWFAYGPWAQAHRDAVAAFTTVLNRGAAYTNAHYRDLIPMISGFSHISTDVLAKMEFATIATSLDPAMIQPVINAAAKYHVIPKAFPAKELIFGA